MNNYAPTIADLLTVERVMDLGSGQPNESARGKLSQLTTSNILGGASPADADMARAVIAALWLYHDFLDQSHTLSQSIESPTGSFLHGIMHRREGDYANAKYWFRRVGRHPIDGDLWRLAARLAAESKACETAVSLANQTTWDHFRFVDLVAQSIGTGSADEELCKEIQAAEWRLIFEFAFRRAVGER